MKKDGDEDVLAEFLKAGGRQNRMDSQIVVPNQKNPRNIMELRNKNNQNPFSNTLPNQLEIPKSKAN
jgi:hypothetical protein